MTNFSGMLPGKAHAALDKAVDTCCRSQPFTDELNRMQFLFALYEELTSAQP
jgi:hypothetical protein